MSDNKVVLITGCSSGFGFLTALKFARSGYQTFASVRNLESEGAKTLRIIGNKESLELEVIEIDVTKENQVIEGVGFVKERTGRIDVLVNNAGFGYLGPIEDFSIDEIKSQYETNIFGVLRMVKAVAPIMRERKSGLIVNVSSIAGLRSSPIFAVYSSSKFAVESLSEALRIELSHFGIKVVLVEPGAFLTDFVSNLKHPQKMIEGSSIYKPLTDYFFSRYYQVHKKAKESFISRFTNPEKVSNLIYKIAQQKNPDLRYLVGVDAFVQYYFHRLLPFRTWEWILHKVYRW